MTSKRIFKIANIAVSLLAVIIFFSVLISFISYKKNPQSIPGVLGFRFLSVLSGSMRPVLEPGDMIVIRHKDPLSIKDGDVITYWVGSDAMVTHRVINKVSQGNDSLAFETKGDSNNTHDSMLVKPEQIVGSMAFRIPFGGYIANFLRSRAGLLLLIIIVSTVLGFNELKDLIKKIRIKEEV